jgi:polysaccharide biosynthesis/export protein
MKLPVLLLLVSLTLFAQETARKTLEAEPAQGYVLQPGDLLDVKFFYNPELNQQAVIRPDGCITLQLVDEVQAAGITTDALTRKLKERYDKDLAHPEIAIVVRSFSSQKAFIDGEVGRPGVIELVNQMTVMQAIAMAGGLRETARVHEVVLIRRGQGGAPQALRIDVGKVMSAQELSGDLTLRPFDVVFVPKSKVSKVNTWIDQYLRKNVPISFGLYAPVF